MFFFYNMLIFILVAITVFLSQRTKKIHCFRRRTLIISIYFLRNKMSRSISTRNVLLRVNYIWLQTDFCFLSIK